MCLNEGTEQSLGTFYAVKPADYGSDRFLCLRCHGCIPPFLLGVYSARAAWYALTCCLMPQCNITLG